MEDSKKQKRRGRSGKDAPEVKIVGIDFNPGPDAQDRRRRLLAMLVKLAGEELPLPVADPLPEGGEEKG